MKEKQMAEHIVGIRQLKEQLSHFVEQVKTGATVVITDRGKPVGPDRSCGTFSR
jgi:PHD/YefM family antitoxin component YafN of YafNO toxin-antitoxin module